jgi:hypothetical protein
MAVDKPQSYNAALCIQDDREFDSDAASGDQRAPSQRDASLLGQHGPKAKRKGGGSSGATAGTSASADLELLMMDDNALLAAREGAQIRPLTAGAFLSDAAMGFHERQ